MTVWLAVIDTITSVSDDQYQDIYDNLIRYPSGNLSFSAKNRAMIFDRHN